MERNAAVIVRGSCFPARVNCDLCLRAEMFVGKSGTLQLDINAVITYQRPNSSSDRER